MAKAEIIEKWCCENCSKLHNDKYGAQGCCPVTAEQVFLCSICGDNERFYSRYTIDKHLKEPHGTNELTPEETYLEALRFGTPPLGEWVETMKAEVEFLIP